MSETFIKIDSLQHLEILRQTYLRRYANFSKLMRTIHTSMTSTFQCEYWQCLTFKRCDKFKVKCTSHGGMYCSH